MKLVCSAVAVYALALGVAQGALTIDPTPVAPPEDIIGEHQPLQKTWTISSVDELEKLHLLIPGRVFIDVEENLPTVAPIPVEIPTPTPAATTPDVASVDGSESEDSEEGEIVVVVDESSSSAFASLEGSDENDESNSEDIVFPTPAPTTPVTRAPSTPVVVDVVGTSSLEGSSSGSGAAYVGEIMQLRRELRDHDSDDDSDDKKKKHHKPTETVIAKIIVSGNSSDLINLFEVIPLHPKKDNGIKIHLKNQNAVAEGYVLTQIILTNKNHLRRLSTILSDDVVLGDSVLVENDEETSVKIATSGAGSVFVKSTADVSLSSMSIDVSGEGSVQIEVPSLKLQDSLVSNVAGNGNISVLADASFKTREIKTAVSGSGNFVVQTKKLTAEDLTAAVYGNGAASFSSAGSVTTEMLTLSGAGKLLVGSIVAERSYVSVWGSGDVVVQATDKLKVTTTFSGSVGYVGERPKHVKTSKWLFWRSEIVHPAESNEVLAYDVAAVPARYPLYYMVATKQVFYAEDPVIETVTDITPSYLAVVSTHLSTVAHGPNGFLIFSMVATTLVAVGLAVNSYQKRRVRRHYRPLV
uniref:Putative auto-transporter adhesin head GIN domain-containing protein n=1 Tax=Globisporangium ultimum (strain ATCC 200006 / CBS 805.95 / DAOM BR144) TaxID=431595 RepID=K3X9F8_GLOUD